MNATFGEQESSTAGPLAGIRVLDFTHALAGPYCTMFLADLGADVLKVEHPRRGDGTRHMGKPLFGDLETDYFASLNRGKRSVGLNLKHEEDRDQVLSLVEEADVLIHNYRPGVMERLGLSYEDCKQRRSDLIYAAISGFGEAGPLRDRGANDITVQAMGGLMSTTGERDGAPLRLGVSVVDATTGLFALSGVQAALFHREKTGEGQRVHVSMLAAATALLANYVPGVLGTGEEIKPAGRAHAQLVPYQAFEASDGKFVIVGAFTQGFWRQLAELLGMSELVDDERFKTNADRIANRDVLVPMLEAEFATKTRDEWMPILEATDIPVAPVLTVAEALRQPQVDEIGAIARLTRADDGAEVQMTGLPIDLSVTPGQPHGFPPRLGEHTEEVLGA
jgi:crotonobetainyl-CoA:carnitine CoA-transferase CaiB-like acyl-CoA transferase